MRIKHLIFFVIILIVKLNAKNYLSTYSSATAQTFFNYSHGIDAINYNPANLGYIHKSDFPILLIENNLDSTIYYNKKLSKTIKKYKVHIQSFQSRTKSDSVLKVINNILNEDSLFVNLQIIAQDSIHSIIINDLLNFTTAEYYHRFFETKKYESCYIDSFFITIKQKPELEKFNNKKESNFYFEILNFGTMISNSSIDANWINTFLSSGHDPLIKNDSLFLSTPSINESEKNNFMEVFPNSGWSINSLTNYKLGIKYKNYAFQLQPDIFGDFIIPTGLFKLAFWGNKVNEPIDFSSRKSQFQMVLPITISYGNEIIISTSNGERTFIESSLKKWFKKIYYGFSVKYLAGLAYFENSINTLSLTPSNEEIKIEADIQSKYSLAGTFLETGSDAFDYSFNTNNMVIKPNGSGIALDVGFIMDINKNFSSNISITNLFGRIYWNELTTYEHKLKLKSLITSDDISNNKTDSLIQKGIEIDSSFAISSFSTKYPGNLIFGAEYTNNNIILASNLKFGFSNELGASTTPILCAAIDYSPIQWITLLSGISIGGYNRFQWSSGMSINLPILEFSFAYSEYGGLLKSATGLSFSTSTSIKF
tara:strand:+ start:798 stop:2582 length:1785 start_codon:yes stop_codon:yes gene_type:complete